MNVHLRTEKVRDVDARVGMWLAFLGRCKEALRSVTDQRAKGNVVRCLKQLMQGVEGKTYVSGAEPSKNMVVFRA